MCWWEEGRRVRLKRERKRGGTRVNAISLPWEASRQLVMNERFVSGRLWVAHQDRNMGRSEHAHLVRYTAEQYAIAIVFRAIRHSERQSLVTRNRRVS
jgi:hypothetical protein